MQKQRNAVEKIMQEFAEQIKTSLTQQLYSSLNDAKIDRQKIMVILGSANVVVDQTYGRYSKYFDKALTALIEAEPEQGVKKANSKSKA